MARNEQAKATIYLDGKQAEAALESLKKKASELRKAMKQAQNAGDNVKYKKLQGELKGVESATRSLRKETFDYERVLRDINGASMNDLRRALRTVNTQMNKMNRTDPGYAKKAAQAKMLRTEMRRVNSSMREQQGLWQKIKGFALPVVGVAAFTAGVRQMIRRIGEAIDASDNFNERLDNLSALTGLGGQELEDLGETAKKTSVKITEGGVRIKQSADDIVDAYTKVGSQRPELLKNGEALASVTEDAIILSEAAKSELEPAVKGLTTTMNQFQIGAEGSKRVINAMAAGSKEGAADIPYLTEAIEKSGTTMNLMNVSLEENIGLIEAIAPNYAKAQLAGNSLDKVFLKLKEKQIGYANGTFSVNAALEELETRYKNGETAASIFGVEHAKMGELLVQSRTEFNRYTKAVTNTNVAIEQARKNTSNANAEQQQARNEFKLTAIALGESLSPAMREFYKLAGTAASVLTRLISVKASDQLKKDRIEMNNLFTAIKHTKEGTEERKKAIDQLNTTYSKYLPNLLSEHSTLIDIEKAQRAANTELIRNIQIKLREEDLEGLARKQKKIMDDILSDVKKQRGESLMGVAESEIFALLDEMASMGSLDEAKNRLGAFAKVYRDASKNIGTYTENLQQFFELYEIRQEQQSILGSINNLSTGEGSINAGGGSGGSSGGENSTEENMKRFLGLDPEEQQDAIRAYFAEAGEGAFEAFMTAIEKEQNAHDINVAFGFKSDEQEEENPAVAYAMEQYKKTKDFQLALNESMFQNGLIGEQQYQDQLTEITRQAEEERYEIKREKIAKAQDLAYMATNFVTALMDMELEKAGDNEEKKKEIKKKYADLNFAVTAAQIIADTAGAIMEGFRQLGPIAGAIAAGILGATGAVQLGVANAQRQKAKGFKSGGYTDSATTDDEVVDYVHSNEFIANAKAVRNPSVKYVLDIIDLAQKNGAISTLNLPAVIGSGGKKTGGYSSQPGMETGASNFAQPYTDPEQNKVLKELTTELRELRKWRPNIAVETIEKKLNDYKEAIDKSGL